MESISIIDDQLDVLASLARNGGRSMDQLVEVAGSVEGRIAKVVKDTTRWQIARRNVASAIVEATAASHAYRTPAYLSFILSGQLRDAHRLAMAVDHLSHAVDYLSSHQPDDDAAISKAERRLRQLEGIVRDAIRGAFLNALGALRSGLGARRKRAQKPVFTLTSSRGSGLRTPRGGGGDGGEAESLRVFVSTEPLFEMGLLIDRAHETFDVSALVTEEVPALILAKVRALLDPLFDARFFEVNEPSASGNIRTWRHANPSGIPELGADVDAEADRAALASTANRSRRSAASVSQSAKHYRPASHGLLAISAAARALTLEIADVLTATTSGKGSDEEWQGLPAQIAIAVFKGILRHARGATFLPPDLLSADASAVFVFTGGAGYGTAHCDGSRTVRDAIYVGLDLVEELWRWRSDVSRRLGPGGAELEEVVTESIREFCEELLTIIARFRDVRGEVDASELLRDDVLRATGRPRGITTTIGALEKDGMSAARRAWLPSLDCGVHESTVNLMAFVRVAMTHYYGALKLVLCEGDVDASDPDAAVDAIEDLISALVVGHIDDLKAMAEAANNIQHMDAEKSRDDVGALASQVAHIVGGDAAASRVHIRISPPVFILNNMHYIKTCLREEAICARSRSEVREVEVVRHVNSNGVILRPGTSSFAANEDVHVVTRKKKKRVDIPIVANLLEALEEEVEPQLEQFGAAWEDLFPAFDSEDDAPPAIYAIFCADEEELPRLDKAQRQALKLHHELLCRQMASAVASGRVHVIMDPLLRPQLVDMAVAAVDEGFQRLADELVKGRTWSRDEKKHLGRSSDEWLSEVKKIL